jgi:hypothetical protein
MMTGSTGGAKEWRMAMQLAAALKANQQQITVINRSEASSERVRKIIEITLMRWGVQDVERLMKLLEMKTL